MIFEYIFRHPFATPNGGGKSVDTPPAIAGRVWCRESVMFYSWLRSALSGALQSHKSHAYLIINAFKGIVCDHWF
ncbi:hypothetical protein A9B99_06355 [Mangrovibacter phragmitis]|uniref:Uncharacterized protein n=1 Tax=Mangrovibacter phragmitis TaxID=1691903 RepID=A0A1B7L3P9_9ENTR|nr:hypothetical protein A9B99_06355 [Mangrovibacter phragmitis]